MSILVVQLAAQGILFAADRNITSTLEMQNGGRHVVVTGQSTRPKVLKWPNRELIVGYVGVAAVEGQAMDQWLYAFIGRHLTTDIGEVAAALTGELDALYRAGDFKGPSILHLGGFARAEGHWTPRIYFIRNTTELHPNGEYKVGNGFDCSEELGDNPNYFAGKTGPEIRAYVDHNFFSFRQGFDLGSFGAIDHALREAMRAIVHTHPGKPLNVPKTLDDWSKHLAFSVHAYGAYFAAFNSPLEQFVGGGADVVTAAWPSD